MKSTLEVYCSAVGWQGGTIHQAMADFKARSLPDQDRICNELNKAYDAGNLSDIATMVEFLRARVDGSLTFKSLNR